MIKAIKYLAVFAVIALTIQFTLTSSVNDKCRSTDYFQRLQCVDKELK